MDLKEVLACCAVQLLPEPDDAIRSLDGLEILQRIREYLSNRSRQITVGSEAQDVEAQMCLYYSLKSEWELRALPIYCEEEDIGELLRWSIKRVVAFGTYLCWIDYKSGMLFCEVFREHLRFSYVKLPVSSSPLSACLDMYQNVCVAANGQVCQDEVR
ncbi:hypothetical protein EJB05_37351, partial [Eragrostis curvula]